MFTTNPPHHSLVFVNTWSSYILFQTTCIYIHVYGYDLCMIFFLHLTYPEVGETVGAPTKTSQLTSSISPSPRPLSSGPAPVSGLSILGCCPPHLFLCRPLALCSCAVPWKRVLASPFELTTCTCMSLPLQFAFFFLHCGQDVVKRPMDSWIRFLTSLLVMWSLYEMSRSLRKHLSESDLVWIWTTLSMNSVHIMSRPA